jgi:hypothetical protein
MALADNLRRILRGQPSLRRQIRGLDSERLEQAIPGLTDRDAGRWKNLYRRDLRQFAEAEAAAAPIMRRDDLLAQQRQAAQAGDFQRRDELGSLIRTTTPRWGSIEQQRDPNRFGSAASRMFRGLYRG